MNSFALLQDEVEDDGAAISSTVEDANGTSATDAANGSPEDKTAATSTPNGDSAAKGDETSTGDDAPRKERDLTLEEYFQHKAALKSGLTSLSGGNSRRAVDRGGLGKMSVLKKEEATDVLDGVAVKTSHETKALKDSTHAAVARNAEIQKFFQRDPNERRPYAGRGRGRGDDGYRGGRGGGGRGRGYDRGPGGDGGRFDRSRGDRFDRERSGSGGFRGGNRSGYRGGFRGGDDRGPYSNDRSNENANSAPARADNAAPASNGNLEGEGGHTVRFEKTGSSDMQQQSEQPRDGGSGARFERAGSGDRFDRGGSGDRFERSDRGDRYDGGRGGRGRFDRGGRGRGRGRGGYHGDGYRPSHDRKMAPKNVVVAPNVDDTVAFPSL